MHPVEAVPAQQVEVVRRCGRHRDRHRALRPQLQEAFDASRGVVGTLPLVAVRQQQYDVGQLSPLGFARADELVDDRLRSVDEVAELRLPQHQGVGISHGVAVFEADGRVLRQRRVVHQETAAVGRPVRAPRQQVQRGELGTGVRVDHHGVALGEGAAPGVLTGQPDEFALGQEGSQCQEFGERPVDLALVGHLAALLQHRLHPRMHGESLGHREVRVADASQKRLIHRGAHPARDHLGHLHRFARFDGVLL